MISATIAHLSLGRSISEIRSVFSICVTVVVLNVHFRSPQTHKMAPWVKRVSWGHMNCTSILVELVIIAFINMNSKAKNYKFGHECFFCNYICLAKLFKVKHSRITWWRNSYQILQSLCVRLSFVSNSHLN